MSEIHPPGAALLSFALGLLEDAHTHGVSRHLDGCRRCTQQTATMRHHAAHMAFALTPCPPPPLLRDALLQAVGEIHRLSPLIKNVARILRLSNRQATSLLERLDAPMYWQVSGRMWILPLGAKAKHSPLPKRLQQSGAYFARLPSGARSERHVLMAGAQTQEAFRVLILQGVGVDARGKLWRPGHERWVRKLELQTSEGCDVIVLVCPRRARHKALVRQQASVKKRPMQVARRPLGSDGEGLH